MVPKPKVGVLIIVWNRPMFVRTTAYAVREAGLDPVIWDDGSDCEYTAYELDRLRAEGFEVCRCDANLGRDVPENAMMERFIRQGAEVLVSMEDACWPLPGTLEEMIAVLLSDPRLGIVGPRLNTPGIPEQHYAVEMPGFEEACQKARLQEARGLLPPPDNPRWRTIVFTDPGCWAIRPECWRATDGTDTSFWMGWGQANDFCYRARLAGWHSAVALDAYAYMADHGLDHVDCPWARPGILETGAGCMRRRWEAHGNRRLIEKYGSVGNAYALFRGNFVPFEGRGTD